MIKKQYLEDIVINTTTAMLNVPGQIEKIAKTLCDIHKKEASDNTHLKFLTKRRDVAIKACKNLIKAIEQGIITEQTKKRLHELETEISRLEFDIDNKKQRSFTFLTVEDMVAFLHSKVFDATDDINVRKLLVNTFILEIVLYKDKIIITYNFTDIPSNVKPTPEHMEKINKQSTSPKTAAFSSNLGSSIHLNGAPNGHVCHKIATFCKGRFFCAYYFCDICNIFDVKNTNLGYV